MTTSYFIEFKVGGIWYGIPARQVRGIAQGCPWIRYPGLPMPVMGIVVWGASLFPILEIAHSVQKKINSFLFLAEGPWYDARAFALPIFGSTRVALPKNIETLGSSDGQVRRVPICAKYRNVDSKFTLVMDLNQPFGSSIDGSVTAEVVLNVAS